MASQEKKVQTTAEGEIKKEKARKTETVQETTSTPETHETEETVEKESILETETGEKEIREKLQVLFSEEVAKKLEKLAEARKQYEPLFIENKREEQRLTKIQQIWRKLGQIVTGETKARNVELETAKDTYNAAVNDFAFCLNTINVEETIETLGEKGLKIAQEEKEAIEIRVIFHILADENKAFQNAEAQALSEKDRELFNKLDSKRGKFSVIAGLADEENSN